MIESHFSEFHENKFPKNISHNIIQLENPTYFENHKLISLIQNAFSDSENIFYGCKWGNFVAIPKKLSQYITNAKQLCFENMPPSAKIPEIFVFLIDEKNQLLTNTREISEKTKIFLLTRGNFRKTSNEGNFETSGFYLFEGKIIKGQCQVAECTIPTTKLSEFFSKEFFEENPSEQVFQKDYLQYVKDFYFESGETHLFFHENEPIESLIFFITYGHG